MIDQTNDPGYAHLCAMLEIRPLLAEMCKTAEMSPETFQGLPDAAFAWPAKRMFPIHNREHVGISYGYSKTASTEIPRYVHDTLRKAAEVYDISEDVYATGIEKVSQEPYYLLPEKQRFAIFSAQDVVDAESAYIHKYAELTVEDQIEAGFRLVGAARQYGVELQPSTEKLAGFTMSNTQLLRDELGARGEACRKVFPQLTPVFDKIASEFATAPLLLDDREYLLKLARIIHGLDKQAGIDHLYGRKITTPVHAVFNTDLRPSAYVKVAGVLQDKALLQSLPLSFWKDALGDDVAREIAPGGQVDITALEQVLPTLPADLKATLQTQLAAYSRK